MIKEVESSDISLLNQLVKGKYGYDFSDYAVSSFKRRLIRILDLYRFDSFNKLLVRIENNPTFFTEFLSEITVNVTEMFRDPTLGSN
jgi:chemotaxis protein methyltransferase CheR